MEWAEETIQRLRELWDQNPQLSTAQIGLRLGVSKNAVVGKAHRIGLPARPSPIRYTSEPHPRGPRRPPMRKETLPLLSCLNGSAPTPEPSKPYVPRVVHPRAATERPTAAMTTGVGPVIQCCWPIGDPGQPGFHFCSGKSLPGRSYCKPHCQIAYVRVGDQREDAA